MDSKDASNQEPVIEVEVEFNQQQDVVLGRFRKEGKHGTTDSEIIRQVLRDYLRLTSLL